MLEGASWRRQARAPRSPGATLRTWRTAAARAAHVATQEAATKTTGLAESARGEDDVQRPITHTQ